jgi:hypothetical protein
MITFNLDMMYTTAPSGHPIGFDASGERHPAVYSEPDAQKNAAPA